MNNYPRPSDATTLFHKHQNRGIHSICENVYLTDDEKKQWFASAIKQGLKIKITQRSHTKSDIHIWS